MLIVFQATARRQQSKKTCHHCVEKSQMEYIFVDMSYVSMVCVQRPSSSTHFELFFCYCHMFSFTYLSSSQFL